MCFRVSLGTYKRAVWIVNALALAAPVRGFTVREDEKEGRIVFAGHNAEVQLRVTEPLESKTRPRTRYDGKVEQEKYYVPTGRLRITLFAGDTAQALVVDLGSAAPPRCAGLTTPGKLKCRGVQSAFDSTAISYDREVTS